jgi:hypothetical protein
MKSGRHNHEDKVRVDVLSSVYELTRLVSSRGIAAPQVRVMSYDRASLGEA